MSKFEKAHATPFDLSDHVLTDLVALFLNHLIKVLEDLIDVNEISLTIGFGDI